MTIVAITGSTGFIGSALVAALRDDGVEVVRVVRGRAPAGERAVRWDPARGQIDAAGLEGIDAVVHLAGESVAGLWTRGKRRRIRESRVKGTTLLATALADLRAKPRVLVSASAVGYYGDRPASETVDESSGPGTGFLARTAAEWEAACEAARDAGIRVVNTRFGNVLHPSGGMLRPLLPLFKLGVGGKFGDGKQGWPWVSLRDVVDAIRFAILRDELSGPVNVVAPEAVSNAEFTRTLGRVLRRPTWVRVPAFKIKLLLGDFGREGLLGGAYVVPRKLQDAGFPFRDPDLELALRTMLGKN